MKHSPLANMKQKPHDFYEAAARAMKAKQKP
jgi:hypothetical protein